ncbi:MAG: autotransporter-associated beta strand repeat-containing protein [Chitinispirillaceae bacterium]
MYSFTLNRGKHKFSVQFFLTALVLVFCAAGTAAQPVVSSLSPEDEASNVPLKSPLIIEFDSDVIPGSGSISVYHSDDTELASYSAADARVGFDSLINDFDEDVEGFVQRTVGETTEEDSSVSEWTGDTTFQGEGAILSTLNFEEFIGCNIDSADWSSYDSLVMWINPGRDGNVKLYAMSEGWEWLDSPNDIYTEAGQWNRISLYLDPNPVGSDFDKSSIVRIGLANFAGSAGNGNTIHIDRVSLKRNSGTRTVTITPPAFSDDTEYYVLIDDGAIEKASDNSAYPGLVEDDWNFSTGLLNVPQTHLSWDTSTTAEIQAGSGTWGSDDFWTTDGSTLEPWPGDGNNAIFEGDDGAPGDYTVTVNGTQQADSIWIESDGYALEGDTVSLDEGILSVAETKTASVSAVLSAPNGFEYNGGTLILSGANDITGTAVVNSGTLNIRNDLALGSAADASVASGAVLELQGIITVSNDAVLDGAVLRSVYGTPVWDGGITLNDSSTFEVDEDLSVTGVVEGTGDLVKTGTARLSLEDSNTFTGNTIISAGEVLLDNENALGDTASGTEVSADAALVTAGDIANGTVFSEPLTLNAAGLVSDSAGALRMGMGSATSAVWSGPISLGSASSIGVPDSGDTLIIESRISGADVLTKLGDGTLLLTNNRNSFSSAVVSGGVLRIGNGTSGFFGGDILNDAALVFHRSTDTTYGGDITGSGSLQKLGDGTLILTGSNDFSGGTTVSDGILQIASAGSIEGDIANEAGIVFDKSSNSSYGGVISGIGTVTKQGTDTLTLTGDNTYEGLTSVSEGALLVNGTVAGSVSVDAGATLGGSGTVTGSVSVADEGILNGSGNYSGAVTIDGILSPGVGGEAVLETGSLTLSGSSQLEFDIGSTKDSVAVNGDLVLDGVIDIAEGADFEPGVYGIISASGDITDKDLVIRNTPVDSLHYKISIDHNSVNLVVSNDLPISNPLVVNGTRLTNTTMELSVSGYSGIPAEESQITSYADSVGIWHRYGSFYPDPPDASVSSDNLLKISLSEMQEGGNTYKDTLTVPEASAEEFYFLAGTVFWYDVENEKDSIPLFNTQRGDSVFMVDPETLTDNPLAVSAQKVSDSEVSLTIDGYETIPHQTDPHKPYADSIGVWYRFGSFYDSPDDSASVIKFPVADLKEHDPYTQTVTVAPSEQPSDSFYFFNATVLWRIPPDDETVVPYSEMSGGDSVYMRDPVVEENEIRVKGRKIAPDTVELTIRGYSALPHRVVDYRPYVDSVGVWYNYGSYPEDPSWGVADRVSFSLSEMKDEGGEPYIKRIHVPSFEPGSADSSLYFLASAHWCNPDSVPAFDEAMGDSVFMAEVALPVNTCTISAEQPDVLEDSVDVTVSGVESLDHLADSIRVYFSFTDLFIGDHFAYDEKAVADVDKDSYSVTLNRPEFVGETDTVYTRIEILGTHKKLSDEVDTFFTVGRPRPENTISGLEAEAVGPEVIKLSWEPLDGVDSVFMFFDTVPISSGRYPRGEFSDALSAAETGYDVVNLESEKRYYFALALVDARNDSVLVSDVTENAMVDEKTTDANSVDHLENLIVIDSSVYIDSTLEFRVGFHLSDTIYESVDYGYVISLNPDDSARPQEAFSIEALEDTFYTDPLGASAMFDTTYYIMMYMGKDGVWTEQAPEAIDTVNAGSFLKQPVVYFEGESQDDFEPVYANNRKIVLRAESGWQGTVTDTVTLFDGGSDDGFISVSDGFRFVKGEDSPDFSVGLVAESIPEGYSLEDVRMYRWVEGKGWMIAQSESDPQKNVVSSTVRLTAQPFENAPFKLMIDTQKVDLKLVSELGTVAAGEEFCDTFSVEDNIANVSATLVYGKADEEFREPLQKMLESEEGRVSFTVPQDAAAQHLGVRALLIVTDGRHTDTLNVSRQVRSDKYILSSVSRKWVPFHAKVKLDSLSAKRALSMMLEEDEDFEYDNTRFRLFRWFQTSSNRDDDDHWVEFDQSIKDSFDLVPGRLMWLKTDGSRALDLGASVSSSLRDTFTMVLPPKEWTDFVLPYNFPVRIADILDATGPGSDQIEFYSWVQNDSGLYRADLLYTPGLDSELSDSTRELGGDMGDAFTIRNYSKDPVILRIPPVLSAMSKYNNPLTKKKSGSAKDVWYVTVNTRTSHNARLNSVMVGCALGKRALSVPPSFGNEKVTVLDEQTGNAFGHLFSPELEDDGGHTFTLRFSNAGRNKSTFTYSAQRTRVPDDMQVVFVNATTGEIIEGNSERGITVDGRSHEDVFMVVGTSEYIQHKGVSPQNMKFRFGGINVNHSHRTARVRYYVPMAGVQQVEFTVLDIKGRTVWRHTENGRASVWNTVYWNGRTLGGGPVSAGSYLMRIRALNGKGKTAALVDRRFMLVP